MHLFYSLILPRSRISTVDKERLVVALERNEDYQELADQFGIKRTSVAVSLQNKVLASTTNAMLR